MTTTYVSGHHPSVLKSHTWRTAANSAPHLLPILHQNPHFTLLDVGCGPGTITLDFAAILTIGHVYGIDPSSSVIEEAKDLAEKRGITNVTFLVGDIFELGNAFRSKDVPEFDVCHAHQVIQHVSRPVEAIRAMAAVLKKQSGILACRETDMLTWAWWPQLPALENWRQTWLKVTGADGCDANAGRRLISWAMEAGFQRSQIVSSVEAWGFDTPADRDWWGGLWSERVVKSDFAAKAIEGGFASADELKQYAEAWKEWAAAEDGWFAAIHGQVLCHVADWSNQRV